MLTLLTELLEQSGAELLVWSTSLMLRWKTTNLGSTLSVCWSPSSFCLRLVSALYTKLVQHKEPQFLYMTVCCEALALALHSHVCGEWLTDTTWSLLCHSSVNFIKKFLHGCASCVSRDITEDPSLFLWQTRLRANMCLSPTKRNMYLITHKSYRHLHSKRLLRLWKKIKYLILIETIEWALAPF